MAVTQGHLNALIEMAWSEKKPARPMRRKLEAEGLTINGQVSPYGLSMMVKYAPRSRWEPPRQQGPAQRRVPSRLMLPLALAAILGGGSHGR